MPVDVSIIIVTYNAMRLIDRCLEAVDRERTASGLNVEVIVIDNASTDATVEHVRSTYPWVTLRALTDNRGFAAGNNAGFEIAAGRYWVLLNTDAFLEPGSLSGLRSFMDSNPDVSVAGPKIINEDGSLQRSARAFPTTWRLATEFFYLRRVAPRSNLFNRFYEGAFDYDSTRDVDFLQGACLIVRAADALEIGAMDESYFMYSEETDWCRRMHDADRRVVFTPDAQVTHLGGGSARTMWQRMYNHQVENHIRYLALNESLPAARRAKRVIRSGLLMRSVLYRVGAALSSGATRDARLTRAAQFADARHAIKDCRPESYKRCIPRLRRQAAAGS